MIIISKIVHIQDSSNDNVINVKNDGLDNIKKNKVIYKNVNDNPSDTNKLNHNSIEKFKHIRRNMVSQIEELLELTVHSNDLLVDVFHIINNNNPKMAIKKLNKYNSNNNYKFIQELL
jgi:peroxiredoxin family protein